MKTEQDLNRLNQQEESELNVMDLLRIGLANWYWFVLSVVICLGLAFFYLKGKPFVYNRMASVLIKDEMRGAQMGSESTAFEELNLLNVKSSVDNEVLVFKSKRLVEEVARRLKLDVSYRIRKRLRDVELYTNSPVAVSFPDATEGSAFLLQVTPLSENRVLLSGFPEIEDSIPEGKRMQVLLNDTVETPIGRVVVAPTSFYTEDYYQIPVTVKKSNLKVVASACNGAIQSTLASKTATIINLSLTDAVPVRAEDILNTLIDVYNEDAVNDKNRIAVNTSNFIDERLQIIEKELGGVDSEIELYKRKNQLTDIKSEAGVYLQSTSRYQQESLDLENQRTLALFIRDYLTDMTKKGDLIPSNTGLSDQNIERLISEYNEQLLKRDKLISNSSDRNPVVMDLSNSLAAMRQTIVRSVDNLITSLNIKTRNTMEQENQTKRRITAVPGQQKYVLSVERQQKIKEALYLYLLNKREENALSMSITESNARIIDPASGSSVPVAPKVKIVVLAAFVLGCVIPAGILWLLTILDTRVRTRKDVEDKLSVPFLGEIPLRKKDEKEKSHGLVVSENGRDAVSEAFRIVRTNMDFMQVGAKKVQVVMFTSLNVSAGKTFVSSNLAISLALAGKKVVLVDLDIRKGTLSSHIHSHKIGITNYLSGKEMNVDHLIQSGEYHPNLDIIGNGPVPPNPAELLLSDRLDQLIEDLRVRYDFVILDNVPSNMIADAMIVNRVADLTLYVIRSGAMDRRQLPEVEKLYVEKRLKNMAVVLNGVEYGRSRYGYYRYGSYGYYGHYAYGYGYGHESKKK